MTAADAAAVLLDELLPPDAGAAQLEVALGELRRRTDSVRRADIVSSTDAL